MQSCSMQGLRAHRPTGRMPHGMERRQSALSGASAESATSAVSVALTEEEILDLAHIRATTVLGNADDDSDGEEGTERFSRTSSFRDLPTVSRKYIFVVIAATVVFAPSVMLTAHVSTHSCWGAAGGEEGLLACGEETKAKFSKPWFLCWSSYVGQSMCLILAWLNHRRTQSSDADAEDCEFGLESPLGSLSSDDYETKRMLLCGCCCGYDVFHDPSQAAEEGIKVKPYREVMIGVVPTFSRRSGNPIKFKSLSWGKQLGLALFPGAMDMATCALQFVSLLYIPPSLTIMFKGLSIVWVTIFSPRLLPGREIFRYQYLAVVIALLGAVMIGVSAMMQEAAETSSGGSDSGGRSAVLGIIFAVLAGFCAAIGSMTMEKMMVELDVDASTLVGVMGVVGFFVSAGMLGAFHFVPGTDNGSIEDSLGTVKMLESNPMLMTMMVLYATVISGGNNWVLGEATRVLSSVTMLLIRNVCTLLLWGIEIALFYGVAGDHLGSPLFLVPGLIKLAGFAAISCALSLYVGLLRLPLSSLYPAQSPPSSSAAADTSDPVSASVVCEASSPSKAVRAPSLAAANSMRLPSAPNSSRRLHRANAVRLTKAASRALRVSAAKEYAQRRRMAIF